MKFNSMLKNKIFSPDQVDKLKNLNESEGLQLMNKVPVKKLSQIYAKVCTSEQIDQLLEEWDKFIINPSSYPDCKSEPQIKKRYEKKMKFLLKAFKRKSKSKYLDWLEKYSYLL